MQFDFSIDIKHDLFHILLLINFLKERLLFIKNDTSIAHCTTSINSAHRGSSRITKLPDWCSNIFEKLKENLYFYTKFEIVL